MFIKADGPFIFPFLMAISLKGVIISLDGQKRSNSSDILQGPLVSPVLCCQIPYE